MARSTPNQYPVRLTGEQRERFEQLTRTGRAPVNKVRHARVLLLSDRGRPTGPLTRGAIADALGMHANTVDRLRRRSVREGGNRPSTASARRRRRTRRGSMDGPRRTWWRSAVRTLRPAAPGGPWDCRRAN